MTASTLRAKKYNVDFELDGQWVTIRSYNNFKAACKAAATERKAMQGARETSVILAGDPECLRRKTCEKFELV